MQVGAHDHRRHEAPCRALELHAGGQGSRWLAEVTFMCVNGGAIPLRCPIYTRARCSVEGLRQVVILFEFQRCIKNGRRVEFISRPFGLTDLL